MSVSSFESMLSLSSGPHSADAETFLRAIFPVGIDVWDVSTWSWQFMLCYTLTVLAAIELVAHAVPWLFGMCYAKDIKVRGRHLDRLSWLDLTFINFNKLVTVAFTYHFVRFAVLSPHIVTSLMPASFTWMNTLATLPFLFLIYDFFYVAFHRFLHVRWMYGYVHKHHHRQMSPSRGYNDASNVHPFEFVIGEYLHIVASWLCAHVLFAVAGGGGVHASMLLAFLVLDAVLAPMNHTRMNVHATFGLLPFSLWAVEAHDVHHRYPRQNYGQYTMAWDRVWGSYMPYEASYKPLRGKKKFDSDGDEVVSRDDFDDSDADDSDDDAVSRGRAGRGGSKKRVATSPAPTARVTRSSSRKKKA